jgi:hypothetical protein
MTISSAFEEIPEGAAHSYLERYFGLGEWQDNEFMGAHFDTFGTNAPNAMTADDLTAVACLSTQIPARAASRSTNMTNTLVMEPLDVVLWMHGSQGAEGPESVEESEES